MDSSPDMDFASYLAQQQPSPQMDPYLQGDPNQGGQNLVTQALGGTPSTDFSRAPIPEQPSAVSLGTGGPTMSDGLMGQMNLKSPEEIAALKAKDADAWKTQEADIAAARAPKPPAVTPMPPPSPLMPAQGRTVPDNGVRPGVAPRSGGGTGGSGMGAVQSPGARAIEANAAEQKAAASAAADVQMHVNDEQAKLDAQVEQQTADRQARVAKADEAYKSTMTDAQRGLQKETDDWAKINTVVDPGRYMGSMSTPSKILTIIGAFAGGFAKGGNPAIQMLQQAISEDIDAQKATIQGGLAKGKEAINNRVTQISALRQKYQDEKQAEDAAWVINLDDAAKKTQVMMDKYKDPETQARLKQTLADINQKKTDYVNSFMDKAHSRAMDARRLAIEEHRATTEDARAAADIMRAENKGAGKDAKASGADAALPLLDDLDRSFKEANKGVGGSLGQATGIGKGGEYGQKIKAYAPAIAKAVFGTTKAATPEQLKYIEEQLPGLITRGTKAHTILQNFRNVLGAQGGAASGAPSGDGLDLREE